MHPLQDSNLGEGSHDAAAFAAGFAEWERSVGACWGLEVVLELSPSGVTLLCSATWWDAALAFCCNFSVDS